MALQKLPVVFAIDRAGMVGADGATHAGVFDVAYLRCIPNLSIACPADEQECRRLLTVAYAQDHAVAVRYPRGHGPGVAVSRELEDLESARRHLGRAQVRRHGNRLLMLVFGTLLHEAMKAAESLDATVVNMRWIKPLDEDLLAQLVRLHDRIVTVEESCVTGGAGSAVMQWLHDQGHRHEVLALGLPDAFTEQGDPLQLLALHGLDAAGMVRSIHARWPQSLETAAPTARGA